MKYFLKFNHCSYLQPVYFGIMSQLPKICPSHQIHCKQTCLYQLGNKPTFNNRGVDKKGATFLALLLKIGLDSTNSNGIETNTHVDNCMEITEYCKTESADGMGDFQGITF